MIICSNKGARPNKLALESFMKLPKKGVVYVKGNKYHSVANPTEETIESIFENKYAYCLCKTAEKNEKKYEGFFNPTICCRAENGMWAVWKGKKITTIDVFYKDADSPDVLYSDIKWKPAKKLELVNGQSKNPNFYYQEITRLFTKDYIMAYADWDKDIGRWRFTNSSSYVKPYGYEDTLYTGPRGEWLLDDKQINLDDIKLDKGNVKKKVVRRIEKYVKDYIEDMKHSVYVDSVTLGNVLDYYDREYYVSEMQAAQIVLSAVKMLKDNGYKISGNNLTTLLDKVKLNDRYRSWKKEKVEAYFIQHIETIEDKLL